MEHSKIVELHRHSAALLGNGTDILFVKFSFQKIAQNMDVIIAEIYLSHKGSNRSIHEVF